MLGFEKSMHSFCKGCDIRVSDDIRKAKKFGGHNIAVTVFFLTFPDYIERHGLYDRI